MTQTLPALEGTTYTAEVVRDGDGDYLLHVYRPATKAEVEMFHPALGHIPQNAREEIARRCIAPTTDHVLLNRLVEDAIRADKPSIVGSYAATPAEQENE